MAEFFVVIAGAPDVADSEVVLSRSPSARQAHEGAAVAYRERRGIAPNVHVRTVTAYRSDDEVDARLFVSRLFAEMDALANGAGADR